MVNTLIQENIIQNGNKGSIELKLSKKDWTCFSLETFDLTLLMICLIHIML